MLYDVRTFVHYSLLALLVELADNIIADKSFHVTPEIKHHTGHTPAVRTKCDRI